MEEMVPVCRQNNCQVLILKFWNISLSHPLILIIMHIFMCVFVNLKNISLNKSNCFFFFFFFLYKKFIVHNTIVLIGNDQAWYRIFRWRSSLDVSQSCSVWSIGLWPDACSWYFTRSLPCSWARISAPERNAAHTAQ